MRVYLSGPIAGLTYGDATNWRQYALEWLAAHGVKGLSPFRGKEYLEHVAKETPFTVDGDKFKHLGPLSTNKGLTTRDRWDSMTCDVLLVNLLGATRPSFGTVMEIAWADSCRIPIVLVMEAEGNLHDHGMINEVAGYRVATLEEGLNIVKAILS
jgi:nucleoside 2-deoxyribosyltransferase